MSSLNALSELADLTLGAEDLDEVLGPALRLLSEAVGLRRAALGLIHRQAGHVALLAAHGLTPRELRAMTYRLGRGITGTVAEKGEPAVVRSIGEEPRFINDTGMGEASFFCVPVGRVGVLSAYRPLPATVDPQQDLRLLTVAAALLAPLVRQRLAEERPRPARLTGLIGRSKAMRSLAEQIGQVARSTTTVLVRGESGTGKERVARILHEESPRSRRPFVGVNCAALPEHLIESELFGHERGAFTGAHAQRRGRFELAEGGTLLLDEVGDLSLPAQVKLLRVLQERCYERVGGSKSIDTDVRVVAATSRDLEVMIEQGSFRQDLYYRLNVFPIRLPPLRERGADVLLLTDYFVELFNRAHGKNVRRIATSAIDMLMAYHWPGNVRELENCIERSVLVTRGDVLQGHHLPPTLQTRDAVVAPQGLKAQVKRFERELVLEALKSSRGNMSKAARELQITERIMGLRVGEFHIDPRRYRVNPTFS
jgi:Nif-specific regulatory protein